jgi:L-fuculose-phosphate aldolase
VRLHLGAYARKDVLAVIHAHPPEASAYALCQAPIGPIGMPEVVVSLGNTIPLVPLFLPKDDGVKAAVTAALAVADVALLAGNGVIAVGPDLETAFLRLELLEHYAKILTRARGRVGDPVPLEGQALERLIEMRKKAGLHRGGGWSGSAGPSPGGSLQDTLRLVVAEEVKRALGGKS